MANARFVSCLTKIKEGVKHKCGHGQCANCLEYVDLYRHHCHIVSECYRDNTRRENKQRAEERCLEAIKMTWTTDGHIVQDILRKPITFKEKFGKQLSRGYFFQHKRRCGMTEHRVQCPHCPLTFAYKGNVDLHIRQRHSNNPLRFPCTICGKILTTARNLRLHMETFHADEKPCFGCWYCDTRFTRKNNRQRHMRRYHERICREQDMNLLLHLQHLSEEDDFKNEWVFVESGPIQSGEHNACPCGQTKIRSLFFLENKSNGNRTFVGSECIRNIDPKAAAVIGYFKHILENEVQEIYKGQDNNIYS